MGYLLCLDTETTGLNPFQDEILQLAMLTAEEGTSTVATTFNRYYKPELTDEWTQSITIHGITPASVADQNPFRNLVNLTQVQSLIDGATAILGYNLAFDLRFLHQAGIKFAAKSLFDVMFEFADFYGPRSQRGWNSKRHRWRNYKLKKAARYYGEDYKPHDALADATMTWKIWNHLLEEDIQPHSYTWSALKKEAHYRTAPLKQKNQLVLLPET